MNNWGSSPIVGRLGRFGKGYELVCSLGIRHVICKPRDKPDQQYIKRPLMQMWVCATYGEQFLCRLHEWKNPHNILSKLFCYVVEDEHSIAQYTRSDIIRFLALKLEQRQLLIFETDELSLTSSATSYTGVAQQTDTASKSTLVLSVSDHEISGESPGSKGNWNKALNGKLLPEHKYKVDSHLYETDKLGRVNRVSGNLDLTSRDRNTYQQGKSAKENGIKDGLNDDDGGHLIASIFDGAGEQINYAPMNSNLNRGVWKRMENSWAKALKGPPPKDVKINIKAVYEDGSKRPSKFIVKYTIDGEPFKTRFKNKEGGD